MNINASLRFDAEYGMVSMDVGKEQISIYNNLSVNKNSYSPNQVLLLAMGSCASADILSILKKMHLDLSDFQLKLEGDRFDTDPMVLRSVDFSFTIKGNLTSDGARKAIDLALSKYCSATILARLAGTNVTYSLMINDEPVYSRQTPPAVERNPFNIQDDSAL
jgi:putative redox protein